MGPCIKGGQVVPDVWAWADGPDAPVPDEGDVVVPLARWLAERPALLERRGRTGVLLDPPDEPRCLAEDVGHLDLVAVRFPVFTDGRGYSTARLLRERYGFRGELRAVGDVLRDQLFYLARCGFDAFSLREDQDVGEALGAFADFSEAYQAAWDRGPLFARRATQGSRP